MELKILKLRFLDTFKTESEQDVKLFFSPGRINLIGEHVDNFGGFVFPAAIKFGTYAAVTKRFDGKVALYSGNFPDDGVIEFTLTDLTKRIDEPWSVYAKGVIDVFVKSGYDLKYGFNAYIEGTIPNGAGLSSSASLELLIAEILDDLHDFNIHMVEKVKMAQQAENDYVGVSCGIMDQFAIGMGKAGRAIKLNCSNLEYEYANCDLQNYRILIMNTNKQRGLADSKYNERRTEADTALQLLQTKTDINHLCDLTVNEFDVVSNVLVDDSLYRRAKHAITENERVKLAIKTLATGDLIQFGKLLDQSHISLRDDFEVSCIELDTIVELAREQEGVLGARMVGAGFGGCAIALVHIDKLDTVQEKVAKGYYEAVGYNVDFYIAEIGEGTRQL